MFLPCVPVNLNFTLFLIFSGRGPPDPLSLGRYSLPPYGPPPRSCNPLPTLKTVLDPPLCLSLPRFTLTGRDDGAEHQKHIVDIMSQSLELCLQRLQADTERVVQVHVENRAA